MKAFSFIRSSLAGGCYQAPTGRPEESLPSSGTIPKVPSLLFDLEVGACLALLYSIPVMLKPMQDILLRPAFLLQLEDGSAVLTEKQEELGAPAVAAHVRSLTEPRSEQECQVSQA